MMPPGGEGDTMSLHNALQHAVESDHGPDRIRSLASAAGLTLTDEQVADLASRAFGRAYRLERCTLDRDGNLWPDPSGGWWLRCCDEDGSGGVEFARRR